MQPWLNAVVVIDVANMAHAIWSNTPEGQRRPETRWVDPDLASVREVLRHVGVEVTAFQVALPTEQISELGVTPRPERRARIVERSRRWLREQQAALGDGMVTLLQGATDGNREIGVDAMCVLGAIRTAWQPEVDAVVVLTHDTDVMIAQDYAVVTPIYVAGSFTSDQRARLRKEGRRWLDLRREGIAAMSSGTSPPAADELPDVRVEPVTAGDDGDEGGRKLSCRSGDQEFWVSSDLNAPTAKGRDERRHNAVRGSGVVAVTDPYGLSLAAARAIGAARLPTPATVEQLLEELGWDGPVSQFAAVPDIVNRTLDGSDISQLKRLALEQLDGELETVIEAHQRDGNIRTQVTVGRLAVEREGSIDAELRRIEEKQVLTVLAADVMWCLANTDLPVVVLSDRAELTYLLEQLDTFGIDTGERIVRVGLHARPFSPADPTEPGSGSGSSPFEVLGAVRHRFAPTEETAHVVILNGPTTARLVAIDRQLHGPELLAAIHREVTNESVDWRMVRFDAESLGAVLSPMDRPEVEAVFHRMLELDCDIARRLAAGETIPAGALDVDLRFDVTRPCALPTLQRAPTAPGTDLAVVIDHKDGTIHLDSKGDGRTNAVLEVGHGADAYPVGRTVILRQRPGGEVQLVGPATADQTHGRPTVARMRSDGTAEDLDGGAPGPIHEVPDLRYVVRRGGERFLAYRCADGSFQALSTALPHLQPDPVGAPGTAP